LYVNLFFVRAAYVWLRLTVTPPNLHLGQF
jgi:hypothetical protein